MNTSNPLRGLLLLALSAAALSATNPASAQLTRADTAAALLAVAEDFENGGADDIAEALYRHIVERFPGTAAAETAQTRLEGVTDQSSRTGGEVEMKVWSTIYGLYNGGALLPMALGSTEPEAVGFGLLLGGPAGFLVGHKLAGSRPISPGQARAITWGGTWGTIQGAMVAEALDLGDDMYGNTSSEALGGAMIVGGALGIVGGAIAARRPITPGTGTSAMLGSLWGTWFGAASSVLMDIEGDGILATMMLAGNAGLIGGAIAGSRVPISRGRSRLISVGGLIGGFGGVGVALIGDVDSDKVAIGIPLVTSIAGLALGAVATRNRDWDDGSDDAEAAASLPAPGSLLNWSDGDWAFSTPLPTPVLEPTSRSAGRDALVWKVPLLKVRF